MRREVGRAHGVTVHGRVVEAGVVGARAQFGRDVTPERLREGHGLGAGTAPHGGKNGRLGLF